MTVRVELKQSARKEFERLPPEVQRRFELAIDLLARDWPQVRAKVAKRLVGTDAWRLRVGAYRAVFRPRPDVLVFTRFAHRSTAYRV